MSGQVRVESATRVALLARRGMACERLQAALQQAGADVVLVADPSETDAAAVRDAGARAILIALEPAVEDALERYDTLLADPSITVIFDEADLAAQREGWDAARWTRHLAAKLNGHEQVFPPSADIDAALAAESQVLSRYERPESDGDISAFLGEADTRLAAVPRDFDPGATRDSASMFDPVLAEMDMVFPSETDVGTLVLEPVVESPAAEDRGAGDRFRRDLDDLQLRIADMQLEDVRPQRTANADGAVVLLAGIGGPDAVRQLLNGLPATFPRAVLIQQRLEGALHDKLVRQMQRATQMPVHLAEAGAALQRGHVYVLPAGLGLAAQPDGLHFHAEGSELVANLPAGDSAVIVLSGADAGIVDTAMAHALRGALVAGQSPDGCFDPVAAEALVARGAETGAPAELAKKLAARWPSPDQVRGMH
jgi:chemosensory pili system protein ChpB (putative protein-glutamate methylesterase)